MLALAILVTPLPGFAAPTEVIATVDKNPVTLEESFRLTVTANDDVPADLFDSSVLQQDFQVGRTNVSRQTQMINFNTTRSTVWTTTLIPRQTGQFTIPAMDIDGVKTLPIQISVRPVAANAQSQARDIYITAEVEEAEIYVQQQIKYTTRLHLAVDLQSGSLSQPTLKDADIEQVGKDREFTDIINGRRYRIIERIFSIIPNSSGEFSIRGPLFDGEVLDNSRQSFGFFNRTTNVQRVAQQIDINVLPIPANYNTHWLPSEFVQLSEEWQTSNDGYTVGTPVTRTITLTAVGVNETQLPEVNSQYPDSLKSYPEQANTATVQRNGTLVAQRVETVALIPNNAGVIEIPEVSVPWFNVKMRRMETATLPAKQIQVSALQANNESLPPIPQTAPIQTPEITPSPSKRTSLLLSNSWWSLSSWILLLLWLATLGVWWFSSRGKSDGEVHDSKPIEVKNQWLPLQKELMRNQPDINKIQHLLRHWLVQKTGLNSSTISVLLDKLDSAPLKLAVDEMFRSSYGGTSSGDKGNVQWKPKALLDITQDIENKHKKSRQQDIRELRPLYPTN